MIVMPPNAILAKPKYSKLRNGLLAYWPMEEASGTRVDATGRGNNLTDNNTVTQGTGKQGNCADFEMSTSESLSRASTGDMDFRNKSITFNAWVKLETAAIQAQIMGTGLYGAPTLQLYVDVTVYRFLFSYNFGSVVQATGGSPDTNWHMLTGRLQRNSSSDLRLRLYFDGSQVDIEYTGANDLQADSTGTFSMGARPTLVDWYLDGLIDEASIHERALTDAEIKLLYAAGNATKFPFVGLP